MRLWCKMENKKIALWTADLLSHQHSLTVDSWWWQPLWSNFRVPPFRCSFIIILLFSSEISGSTNLNFLCVDIHYAQRSQRIRSTYRDLILSGLELHCQALHLSLQQWLAGSCSILNTSFICCYTAWKKYAGEISWLKKIEIIAQIEKCLPSLLFIQCVSFLVVYFHLGQNRK